MREIVRASQGSTVLFPFRSTDATSMEPSRNGELTQTPNLKEQIGLFNQCIIGLLNNFLIDNLFFELYIWDRLHDREVDAKPQVFSKPDS